VSPVAFKLPGDPETTVAAALYAPNEERDLQALLVFAHGAGAGHFHPFMSGYAEGLANRGVTVVTFNFPYMEKGRKTPDRAPVLEDAFRRAVAGAVEHRHVRAKKLFIGGKSMGGRIASHIAAQGVEGVRGLIFFGYPLHPPGRPEQRRDGHLPSIAEPMLFIQGSADTFGNESEMTALMPALQRATLHIVPGGDHSFKVPGGARAQGPAFDDVIGTAVDWIRAQAR
jgi:predicted alpha/beta-hydrolase family hydrolase